MSPERGSARFPLLLKLLFTLCVAVTGLATVALVVASIDLTRSNRDVEHTLHVQQALGTLQLALVNAETGQRGFLLTGQPHFLEPYIDAVARQAYTMGALERLTAGAPDERREIESLKAMADEALRHMAAVIEVRNAGGAPVDELNRGKILMDRVRLAIEGMRNEQDRALAARQHEVDQRTRYGIAVLLVSDAASLLGLALLYFGTQAYHRRRLRTEAAVVRAEEELRQLFDQAPIGEAECEASSGRILRANRRLAQLTGYSGEELLRTSIIDLLPRANRLDNARAYRELVAGNHDVVTWEQPIRCKDGTAVWSQLAVSAVRSASGEVERTVVAVQDVGSRKRSEQDLAGSEALLRAIVDHTRHLAFAKDPNGRYLLANSALLGALERGAEEIVGHTDAELFPAECAEELRRNDLRVMESRAPDTFEQTLEFAREKRSYVLTEAPFYDEAGQLMGVVGIGTDVTERKHAEDALRAALAAREERLAQTSEEVTLAVERERARLAMELHDELGAAISAVWVELVGMGVQLRTAAPQLLMRQERALKALTATSDKVRRITAGLHPLLLEHVGLAAALESDVAAWSASSGIGAEFVAIEPLQRLSPEHELVLFRVAQEALTNAQKHAHASRVVVMLTSTDDSVRLSVTDDGIGITSEQSTGHPGHGLAGMRERLRAAGGTLWVARRPEGGTEVTARLPLARPR